MEVNLKAQQDAGATTGYTSLVKQGGFSVKSTPDAPKTTVESRPQTSTLPQLDPVGNEKDGKPQKPVVLNEEELQTVTADLSKLMESLNTDIKFSIHKASGRMMVRVVDSKTQDVLKEFPPEELLDTIGAIREYVGALLDKKA